MRQQDILRKFFQRIVIVFILVLFFTPLALGQSQWPHERSDLKPDPDVTWGRLENGFRYVVMKNSEPKQRVSMHLNIQAGSLHERSNERGLAHFLEHMLFQGTKHFGPGELVKFFQKIGMNFGPDANAHTGFDETVYDIILPDGNEKSLRDGLLVMKDYATSALLLEEEIDRERKVILAEKRSRDSAGYRIFESTMEFEFPDALLSKRLPIGVESVLKKSGRDLLKGFYDAWYRPSDMMIVMVGDMDRDLAVDLIVEHFKDIQARAPERQAPDLGKIDHVGIKPFYHFESEGGDASVSIEVVDMVPERPDSLEYKREELQRNIADAIVQNRLNALLRKPNAPFTSASIGSSLFLDRIFYGEISASCASENWERALALMEKQLRKALQFGFTEPELNRVKKDYVAMLETEVQKQSTRDTRELARQIIRYVNSDQVFMSPTQKRDLYLPMIEKLTIDSVHETFRQTWNKNHRLVLVTGNAVMPEDVKAPEARVLSVFNQSRTEAVTPPEEEAEAKFPYLPEPENRGKQTNKETDSELDIVRIDFENGLRLNYKRTEFKANEIKAALSFGPGKAGEPASKPGLSSLSESVINESGLGGLDREALNRALAGKNTTVFFSIGEESFSFTADTVPEELELMFQLLRAYLLDPAYRQEAYDLAMERYRLSFLQNLRSVEGMMRVKGQRFLAGGDSRFGLTDYETFKKLSLDDVRGWAGEAIEKAPLELSVAGDFDPETLVEYTAKYLASLPSRDGYAPPSRPDSPEFPDGKSLHLAVETQIPKAITLVAYPTEDFWDIHTTRRLSILGEVISERLRVTIREKLGASYSPHAYNDPSRAHEGYGVFKEVVFADPEQADSLVEVLIEIAQKVNEEGISEDELNRAINPTMTNIKEMRQKNDYWLNVVLDDLRRHPEQLDWAKSILSDYASITASEVWDLSKKYLKEEKAAKIVITPK